jgi:DNA gyrase subunit B
MSDVNDPPIQVLPFHEAVRKRAAMYIGDTESSGLHVLVHMLLDVVFENATRGAHRGVSLELREDGSLCLFDPGSILPPERLLQFIQGSGWLSGWGFCLPVVFALSSRFQVDMWSGGRQWRAQGARGILPGGFSEVTPVEPMPMDAAHGVRVDFLPDPDIFGQHVFEAERLLQRCRELAFLVPGLRIQFTAPRCVEREVHYPGGLAQRVEELTRDLPRLHPHPLAFEVQWTDVRVRCALQWCESGGGIQSFANERCTPRHGRHVDGVIRALRAALVTLAGGETRDYPRTQLVRGLVALITAEGPRLTFKRAPWTQLDVKGLDLALKGRMRPLMVEALRDHPLLPRLVALGRAREQAQSP